ncbi:DUF2254 domain-containing protein [Myxococcota bacterium]|nr:DUF2254 domain-containing protein [Myxococcota bacterium]MBU1382074.1 DUF2254 domain-containing protein [Myxococcota bacterium]MBU1496188.1 DUF2254 domain-containing protein [Myxococcota bacterium]
MFGSGRRSMWVVSMIALGVIPVVLFLVFFVLDYFFFGTKGQIGFLEIFYRMSVEDSRQILGGMGEVIAAILGIVITVASIIVQLAATRYTPRISEMFFKDRTNLSVLAFFVVSAVYCILVNFVIRGDGAKMTFIPVAGSILNVLLLTISLLLIAPYFLYIFHFLEPGNIVKGIERQAFTKISNLNDTSDIDSIQMQVTGAVEQLADIAMNAIEQKDKGLSTGSIDAMRDLLKDYIELKNKMDPKWFVLGSSLHSNPDFVSMHKEILVDISEKRTWLEYKVLRQYQMIYNESLNRMRDIDYIIAIDTRYLGEEAIQQGDEEVLKLVIKFLNTYIRATLNARDVRTAYNVFHQYRLLAESVLRSGMDDEVLEIAGYFRYYGQLAFSMNLSFITETIAYDLTTLCELAFSAGAIVGDDLLGVLLEVDKEAEGEQQEKGLRGVRKAQIKMATYFLLMGDEERAHRIYLDMKNEPGDRIKSIRTELSAVESKDFWEVIDRGENFDYLHPERRGLLDKFFEKFHQLV